MDSADSNKRDNRSNSLWLLAVLLLLAGAVEWFNYYSLPQQLRASGDQAGGNAEDISVSRARENLRSLTAIGPRVTGSTANDYITPEFLLGKLQQIQSNLASTAKLEISLQTPSSSFHIDFLGGINNVYHNVTNVVARLSWPDSLPSSSVLVNAHFDSVPGSPGAADDGIGIAVMLEAIEVLASSAPSPVSSSPQLKRPIVFLFNGAEEWVHQGAHGFITQHPWASEIDYLVNLEAIGSGGREMVFQCNSGKVAEVYGQAAPYPQASVLAHELFKHFLYRVASTDWSTFIRFGKTLYGRSIRGLDSAYVDNGYVYHTSFDGAQVVPDGTLLNTGENLVHMLRALASLPSLPSPTVQDEEAVFFDLFHTFLVNYSGTGVELVHWGIIAVGVVTCLLLAIRQLEDLLFAVYLEICVFMYTLLGGSMVGLIAYAFLPMRWYDGGVSVTVLTFAPPIVLLSLAIRGHYAEAYLKVTPLLRQLAILILWLLVVIPCVMLHVMTAYLGCLWVASLSFSTWLYFCLGHHRTQSLLSASSSATAAASGQGKNLRVSSLHNVQFHTYAYLFSLFPIMLIMFKTLHATLVMIVPLFGKSGTVVPTDMAMGALFVVLLSMPLGTFTACSITRRLARSTVVGWLTVISLGYIYLSACTFSYSAEHPKRLWIHRVERYFRQPSARGRFLPQRLMQGSPSGSEDASSASPLSDQGLWVSAFDERGLDPILPYMFDYLDAKPSPSEGILPLFSLGRYFHAVHRAYLSSSPDYLERNQDCSVSNGDCYFAFPWYFPVPDALRHGWYLPLRSAEAIANRGAKADFGSIPLDRKLQLSLRSTVVGAWVGDNLLGCAPATDSVRLVEILVRGPSHMNLALRDGSHGKRIHAWWLDDLRADEPVDTKQVVSKLACVPPVRYEGVHYFHIAAGRCPMAPRNEEALLCNTQRLFVLVSEHEHIEVALYGHFVDIMEDPQVTSFIDSMPDWSKRAEWTRFPSILISDVV